MFGLRLVGRGRRAATRPRRDRDANRPPRDDGKARRAYILAHPPRWSNSLPARDAPDAARAPARPGATPASREARDGAHEPPSTGGASQWDV